MQLLRDNLVSASNNIHPPSHPTNAQQTLWTSSEADQPGATEAAPATGENKEAGDVAAPPPAAAAEPEKTAE